MLPQWVSANCAAAVASARKRSTYIALERGPRMGEGGWVGGWGHRPSLQWQWVMGGGTRQTGNTQAIPLARFGARVELCIDCGSGTCRGPGSQSMHIQPRREGSTVRHEQLAVGKRLSGEAPPPFPPFPPFPWVWVCLGFGGFYPLSVFRWA